MPGKSIIRWSLAFALVGAVLSGGAAQGANQTGPRVASVRVPQTQPAHSQPAATQAAPTQPAAHTQPAQVGWVEISGSLRDGPPLFTWMSEAPRHPSLRKILSQLRFVAQDPHTAGVVLYLDRAELDLAQINEISTAMRQARAAGKKVLVFSEVYDLHSYLLACAADTILLQRNGLVELEGLGIEEIYLAGLFDKLGVKADFLQVGKYKGAAEPLTRSAPSPEWSQNIDNVLDDLYAQIIDRIAQARHLDRTGVLKALADCWAMRDSEYVQRGLVDRLVDRDLLDVTSEVFGENFDWNEDLGQAPALKQVDNPFALFRMLFQDTRPKPNRPTIALIYATGAITSGESRMGSSQAGLFGGETIGAKTLVHTLEDVKDDPLIKGVVLRLDSPGGSAIASEIIWQAVHELGETKPVYVSIGHMAASGGYYISSAAHEIYASPNSIIGSIGVVGGKIVLGGLYEKLGLTIYRRSRGPMGDMFNSVEPFTREQRGALEISMQHTYEQFLERVKTGRGQRVGSLDALAQGRIFTGNQCVKNGLIDKIGGVSAVLADLAKQLHLEPGQYDVEELPAPLTLPEYLHSVFDVKIQADIPAGVTQDMPLVQSAQMLLGPRVWRQAQAVSQGLLLLRREPMLLLLPTVFAIH